MESLTYEPSSDRWQIAGLRLEDSGFSMELEKEGSAFRPLEATARASPQISGKCRAKSILPLSVYLKSPSKRNRNASKSPFKRNRNEFLSVSW